MKYVNELKNILSLNYLITPTLIFTLIGCSALKSRKAYSIDGIYIGDYISRESAQKLIDFTWKCSDLSCIPKSIRDQDDEIEFYNGFKNIEFVAYENKNKGSNYEISVFKHDGIYLILILDINSSGEVIYIRHGYGMI